MKRFTLHLSDLLHKRIKIAAARFGMPMNDFILAAVEEKISKIKEEK